MKKIFHGFIFCFIVFAFVSCASTNISSFVNPDIKISSYEKIFVFANIRDIELRKAIENDLVAEFIVKNKNAVSSIEVISPLKTYSPEEYTSILNENNFDCILEIVLLNTSEESVYVPQQTYTYYTTQYVNGTVISIPHTSTSGGYSVTHPKAAFEISLVDIKTGECAMKSTANSEGDGFSNMGNISKSLAKEIVAEFIAQQ